MKSKFMFLLIIFCCFGWVLALDDQVNVFEEGLVSTGDYERGCCFSADMQEFYFVRFLHSQQVILVIRKDSNGNWGEPSVAKFSGNYSDSYPFVTPDNHRLFFCSVRPVETNREEPKDWDIYFVERTATGCWGKVNRLNLKINTKLSQYYPAVSNNQNLYYCTPDPDDGSKIGIYMSEFKNNYYQGPVKLSDQINDEFNPIHPYVDPDEKYIVFASYKTGGGDLYITYKKTSGWLDPKILNAKINTEKREWCPIVSPDGQFLFFSSNRTVHNDIWAKPRNYNQILKFYTSSGNGSMSIYRVKANFLKK